jgi:two-component system LytT family response regulator
VNVIVIEDSRLARIGLIRMLAKCDNITVVADAERVSDALPLIESHKPEALFLDIHLPGENGFELLEKLDYLPKIVFTTAYSKHAVRSFEYNVADYLLKPISQQRLYLAVERLTNATDENVATSAADKDETKSAPEISKPDQQLLTFNSQMFVKDGDHCHMVKLANIRYFESCKNYVRIFFDDKSAFIKKSLTQIEYRLPARYFFRINRQYIVNLHAISQIDAAIADGYDVTLTDGKQLEVSRRNASELKERLSF